MTSVRDQQIANLFREGKGQRAIGRSVGISHVAVRKTLLKQGLLTPSGNHAQAAPLDYGQDGGAAAVVPGRCGRVSRCQGRLWQTVTGHIFCEVCDLAPRGEYFARWVSSTER